MDDARSTYSYARNDNLNSFEPPNLSSLAGGLRNSELGFINIPDLKPFQKTFNGIFKLIINFY